MLSFTLSPAVSHHMSVYLIPALFLTFAMFVSMLFGLVLHWLVMICKLPFPGYSFDAKEEICDIDVPEIVVAEPQQLDVHNDKVHTTRTPTWIYFFLAVPTMFDLIGTALSMKALEYLDASISIMLRGSCIVFVAVTKQNILKDRLQRFHWIGECTTFFTYLFRIAQPII
jgi:drug/metabolite transporter (DMT)-like permease